MHTLLIYTWRDAPKEGERAADPLHFEHDHHISRKGGKNFGQFLNAYAEVWRAAQWRKSVPL